MGLVKKCSQSEGFSAVAALAIVVVLAVVWIIGWLVWSRYAGQSSQQTSSTTDPSEGGKYLAIKEWGVRFTLPPDLRGEVSYRLGDTVIDSDDNHLQAAKFLLKKDTAIQNECAVVRTAQGASIDAATQLIQAQQAKPFDANRYKGTFKSNVFVDETYAYHLNYITPDCADSSSVIKIQELQGSLEHLERTK